MVDKEVKTIIKKKISSSFFCVINKKLNLFFKGECIQVTLVNEQIGKFTAKLNKGKTCMLIDDNMKPLI